MSYESILTIYVVLLGLCVGSFLNVLIVRLPDEKSIGGRSQCPKCQGKIAWYDNIPLLSYLILLGKCRHCKTRISPLYPLVELITCFLSYYTFQWAGQDMKIYLIWFLLFVCPLIAVFFIDFKHQIIPDKISLPGIMTGVAASVYFNWPFWQDGLIFSVKGILIGGGFLFGLAYLYSILRKKEGMGGGDIKLLGMFGAFLGWQGLLPIFLISSVLALLYAIGLMLIQKNRVQPIIPYGPFLVTAALLQLYFGPRLVELYLRKALH